ncbi:hypothetical protein BGX28_005749 [Mortierella sp. GBA30]|nr:hypothetical protein BGX28_005749 [Mortierella sp. GBA30]
MYRVRDKTTTLNDVDRAYGVENMYRDFTVDDCMMFEKLLSKLESSSATFIRKVWSGEALSLTRAQLADLKKFLAIMMYRGEHRRSQYFDDNFDISTRLSIYKHMQANKIHRIQDVWFDNLKWLIKTPTEDITEEFMRAHNAPMNPFAIATGYNGPIHVTELLDFGYMMHNYVCIWEAEEGSEFILSEGCFGAFEGDIGIQFHNFYIVSPKYAIVLVNRLYMFSNMERMPFRKSWFEKELRPNPDAIYTKGPLPTNFTAADFTATDVFKYRRVVVPKQKVYLVNSILLDARRKCLTYKSSISMYKSVRYYDKNKEELFDNKHDYSILKGNLFAEMNRTHSS